MECKARAVNLVLKDFKVTHKCDLGFARRSFGQKVATAAVDIRATVIDVNTVNMPSRHEVALTLPFWGLFLYCHRRSCWHYKNIPAQVVTETLILPDVPLNYRSLLSDGTIITGLTGFHY